VVRCCNIVEIACANISVISLRPTRVNVSSKPLWRSMGLVFSDTDGRLDPTRTMIDHGADETSRDKSLLQMLLWILCRLADLLASKQRVAPSTTSPASTATEHTWFSSVNWSEVNSDVDNLYDASRPLLHPDSVVESPDQTANSCWFLSSTLAMAAIYFHMAKILLLSSMPSEVFAAMSTSPSSAPDWISAYRKLHHRMTSHAKQILSIALGSPPAAVKSHMLQPLYVAGRCLTEIHDQDELLLFLGLMEKEMGMATGYRVQDLLREWGRPMPSQRSELDRELSDLSSVEA
jgi:hypothetical protein